VAVVYRSNALATPENQREHLDVIALDVAGARAEQPFAIAAETRHPYLLRRLRDALVADASARRFRSLGFDWAYSPKTPGSEQRDTNPKRPRGAPRGRFGLVCCPGLSTA